MKKLSKDKREQENYFRVIQGYTIRSIKLHGLYNFQNIVLTDVIDTLQNRRSVIGALETETTRLKALLASEKKLSAKADSSHPRHQQTRETETSVLKVYLEKARKEVTLFKGQQIATPMGIGIIEAIIPQDEKLVVRLPFGLLYANLRRAVCWRVGSGGGEGCCDLMDARSLQVG